MDISLKDRCTGCLIGAAVGDAMGLPYEGLSTRRARRWMRHPLRHRFVLGRGMVSDDTDHLVFVTQALLLSAGDALVSLQDSNAACSLALKPDGVVASRRHSPGYASSSRLALGPDGGAINRHLSLEATLAFQRHLAWRLRWWLLCLPAGIGWGTLRGLVRLWCGLKKSGVFSAGNGPSMRSAVIGAMFPNDAHQRERHVAASTSLTHTDPQALAGAMAMAELTAQIVSGRWTVRPEVIDLCDVLRSVSDHPKWLSAVEHIRDAVLDAAPMSRALELFATKNGVSGYVMHSVPYAILIWYLHHGDYQATVQAAIQAGGDVDTVAAMAGALAGATVGYQGVPSDWVAGIVDRPHGPDYLCALAKQVAQEDVGPRSLRFSPWLFPRGIVFTTLVLLHGLRRLLPPW